MSARKLPSPRTVNRLYWWDGLTSRQILKRYGLSPRSRAAVTQDLRRHGYSRRAPNLHKRVEHCVHRDCEEPMCIYRVWGETKRRYYWRSSTRCLTHHVLYHRARKRKQIRLWWRRKHPDAKPKMNGRKPKAYPIRETAWVRAG